MWPLAKIWFAQTTKFVIWSNHHPVSQLSNVLVLMSAKHVCRSIRFKDLFCTYKIFMLLPNYLLPGQ